MSTDNQCKSLHVTRDIRVAQPAVEPSISILRCGSASDIVRLLAIYLLHIHPVWELYIIPIISYVIVTDDDGEVSDQFSLLQTGDNFMNSYTDSYFTNYFVYSQGHWFTIAH